MPPSHHPFPRRPGFPPTENKVIRLHVAERWLIGLILLQLIFLPWAMGGMRLWTQEISAALAFITFVVALCPRNYTEENSRTGRFHLSIWPRLFHFPLFWLGLLLLGYITIQGLNPAWEYVMADQGWWMVKMPCIDWLPHGTISPMEANSPWRILLVYGAAWLTACSLWVGVTRRRSLQLILIGLVTSALLLAAVAFAQRITRTNKILWFIDSPNEIWATFFYRNHGGAWFNLMVPVFCGLACWHYLRAMRTFAKSSPAPVFGFLALIMIVAVIASYSRGAVLTTLLFLMLFFIAFFIRQFTLPPFPQKHIITILLVVICSSFAFVGLRGLNAKETWDRMDRLFDGETQTLVVRKIATDATFEMWQAEPWLGNGAGSFRFIFPLYQQHHPKIWKLGKSQLFWENAHNDIAQTLAELGIAGSSLIVLGLLWGLIRFVRLHAWANPIALTLALGLGCTVAHSWGEFVFQCPAILVTWVVLAVLSLRWAELEATRQSR